jgi:hypothetical protein
MLRSRKHGANKTMNEKIFCFLASLTQSASSLSVRLLLIAGAFPWK